MEAETANNAHTAGAEIHQELPLFPEEEWYEILLRYGLYLGAAFQLMCILAVLVSPSSDIKDDSEDNNSCSSDEDSDDCGADVIGGGSGGDVRNQNTNRTSKSRRIERKKRR